MRILSNNIFGISKNLFVVWLTVLVFNCENKPQRNSTEIIQKSETEGISIPNPKFDVQLAEILDNFKKEYNADAVRIARPFIFSSKNDYKFWLKIEFVNPKLNDLTFRIIGERSAKSLIKHLTNVEDFDRIEVRVIQKTGFIVTFSTSQNVFFNIDSLRQGGRVVL